MKSSICGTFIYSIGPACLATWATRLVCAYSYAFLLTFRKQPSIFYSGHGSVVAEIGQGEEMEVTVWTRSTTGAVFSVTHAEHKHGESYVDHVQVKHHGTDDVTEPPTSVTLTQERIVGPAKIKVKADSNAGRFSTHNFMVVFNVY